MTRHYAVVLAARTRPARQTVDKTNLTKFRSCTLLHTHYTWSGVWRSQPPPPPWYGLAGVGGGGAGVCGNGRGPLELPLNVARAPVLINLNLYI